MLLLTHLSQYPSFASHRISTCCAVLVYVGIRHMPSTLIILISLCSFKEREMKREFQEREEREMEGMAKKRAATNTEDDRLSSLPDSLLHHVLSFLDMTDVVQTVLLSRRWRVLSDSVSHLNFHFRYEVNFYSEEAFVRFVTRALLINTTQKIHKFQLCFDSHHPWNYVSQVDAWIHFAMRRGVQELDLDVSNWVYDSYDLYVMPSCVLNCRTLISLKLSTHCLGVSNFGSFPNLTTLSLQLVGVRDGLIEHILKGCPRLEDLVIRANVYCTSDIKICSFSSSNLRLKRFTMEGEIVGVDVEAPNLEFLKMKICGEKLGKYSFKDMLFLREACLEFYKRSGIFERVEQVSSLTTSILNLCHARVLQLSSTCIKALSLQELQDLPTSIFEHKRLILETALIKWELPGIAYLLKNSCNLETLIIKIISKNYNRYNLNVELARKYNFDEMVYWESFLSPFSCMMNHLKTIKVWDYDAELCLSLLESSTSEASLETQGNEIKFLKILLRSAMYLEKLTLYITKEINFRVTRRNPKALHGIAQIIRAFPRASSCMQVSVIVSD